jgi:hypothetical protein
MATGSRDFFSSREFYREQDHLDRRAAMSYALDTNPLIEQVGLRVILIEEIDDVRYGVMDGVVVQSDNEFVLVVKDLSDGSIHRFDPTSNFDWYQSKYFMKSSWRRRRKYVTEAARELRTHTYRLFDAALAKGIYQPDEIDHFRDESDLSLRWNLGARLHMSLDSSWSDLMSRIEGM